MTWLLPLLIAVCVGVVVYRGVVWLYETWELGREVLNDRRD